MTPPANVSEFIQQNGAFGVLMLLIAAFCYWGIPYVAKRFEKITEESDRRVDLLITKFDSRIEVMSNTFAGGLRENTAALQGITKELSHTNDRLTDVEERLKFGRD